MPNWCFNTISIYGPDKDVRAFVAGLTDTDGGVKSLLDTYAPLEGEWEYSKAVKHWGTKWADYPDENQRWVGVVPMWGDISTSYINVETAWAPPTEGLAKVSKQWPTLVLSCFATEEAMGFVAAIIAQKGRLMKNETRALPEECFPDDSDDESHERASRVMWKFEGRISDLLQVEVEAMFGNLANVAAHRNERLGVEM